MRVSPNKTKGLKDQETIQERLVRYEDTQVTVEDYCTFSVKALELDQETLYLSYQELLRISKKNERGNYKSIAGFLCRPNITYEQKSKIKSISKDPKSAIDAGRRIIGTICYAWDYYFRLIKNKRENKNTNELQANTLFTAKKRLVDMLKEMEQNRYHWQNYTKQQLTDRHYEEKEIKEEQSQINLLQNLLSTQIKKMKQKNRNIPKNPNQNINQRQVQNVNSLVDFCLIQNQQNKKSIKQLIDVPSYFKSIKNSKSMKISESDTITRCQVQRQTSINAFRYYSSAYTK